MDLTNFNLAVHYRFFVRRGGNKKTAKRRQVKVDYKGVRNINYFVYDNLLRKEVDGTDFILPEDNGPNRQLEKEGAPRCGSLRNNNIYPRYIFSRKR